MLLTPKLAQAIWTRVREEEIGLHMRVESPDRCISQLTEARPPDMRNYTIARTPDPNILYITCPTVTLDDIPVEPDLT